MKRGGRPKLEDIPKRKRIQNYKAAAGQRVYKAVKAGTISKTPCEVCDGIDRLEAHHPDYRFVLDVIWLCRPHHIELHKYAKYALIPYNI